MSRSRMLIGGAVAATALSGAAVAVSATTAPPNTITAKAGVAFKVNRYVKDTAHFVPDVQSVKSGGTLTIRNVGGEDHTFSIVKPGQLPRTKKQMEQCKICQTLGEAHGVDPNNEEAPPTKPVVDVGKTGVDQPGDSWVLHGSTPAKLKVSAKAGTTLRYMCAIHPWMQATLRVK